jgi:hypothetical protein
MHDSFSEHSTQTEGSGHAFLDPRELARANFFPREKSDGTGCNSISLPIETFSCFLRVEQFSSVNLKID